MIINAIYNEKENKLKFNVEGKIYKKKDFDLNKIGFDNYINDIKTKYISSIRCNFNNLYNLKEILFDAKILYDLYIQYDKYEKKNLNSFDERINKFINSKEYIIIKNELINLKLFLIYTYYDHFNRFKN